jgi:hypothetical protein
MNKDILTDTKKQSAERSYNFSQISRERETHKKYM